MNDPILIAADAAINGPRNRDYGDASSEFERIASIWGALLGISMDPADVPRLMIALKLVRSMNSPELGDHWVDIAGYSALAAKVVEAK